MTKAALAFLLLLTTPALGVELDITPLPAPKPRALPLEPSLNFESPRAARIADTGWRAVSMHPDLYTIGTTKTEGMQESEVLVVAQRAPAPRRPGPNGLTGPNGTVGRTVPAGAFPGHRVRLSARLKTRDAVRVQMYLTAIRPAGSSLSYNMSDRPIRGTTDWRTYQIVMDVPPDTSNFAYGFFLAGGYEDFLPRDGNGIAWGDSFKLEIVGKDVAVSRDPCDTVPNSAASRVPNSSAGCRPATTSTVWNGAWAGPIFDSNGLPR